MPVTQVGQGGVGAKGRGIAAPISRELYDITKCSRDTGDVSAAQWHSACREHAVTRPATQWIGPDDAETSFRRATGRGIVVEGAHFTCLVIGEQSKEILLGFGAGCRVVGGVKRSLSARTPLDRGTVFPATSGRSDRPLKLPLVPVHYHFRSHRGRESLDIDEFLGSFLERVSRPVQRRRCEP